MGSAAMSVVRRGLPHFATGTVVKGFGRGSKELGIPTANFPDDVVDDLPEEITTGIYYGWAKVDNGPTHKMVMSIGWNPYYKNTKKSMETHIMHTFPEDFYGSQLSVCMVGYVRPEQTYSSLDALIAAINNDIKVSDEKLELPENAALKDHAFFISNDETNNKLNRLAKISDYLRNGHSSSPEK